jgi:hypothetical protein
VSFSYIFCVTFTTILAHRSTLPVQLTLQFPVVEKEMPTKKRRMKCAGSHGSQSVGHDAGEDSTQFSPARGDIHASGATQTGGEDFGNISIYTDTQIFITIMLTLMRSSEKTPSDVLFFISPQTKR